MSCPGYGKNEGECGKRSRRPNGHTVESEFCDTCRGRAVYARRKATEPDYMDYMRARTARWKQRNPLKVKASQRRMNLKTGYASTKKWRKTPAGRLAVAGMNRRYKAKQR